MSLQARLIQQTGVDAGRQVPLSLPVVLGRSEEVDFVLDDELVSRRHTEVRPELDGLLVIDLESRNGTFLNGSRLIPQAPVRLENGFHLRLGATEFLYYDEPTTSDPPTRSVPIGNSLTIGRAEESDLMLLSPNVSRKHCRITQTSTGWLLEDLHSKNGTYLNGVRVLVAETLREGDEIALDLHRFVLRDGALEHSDESSRVRIDVETLEHVVQQDGKPLNLLRPMSFVIPPQELVAIVGGSGAGKSTLLNALSGLNPASGGTVRLNGVDLYKNLSLFRAVIGYVPQEDVVHRELRVGVALRYAAELRLPPDMSAVEREALVDAVLRELELTHRKTAFVSTLSGGERKRVSVAMELLSQPGILFLDEPTSGLDPGMELKFLKLVKRLAHQGRTVVMVTHSTSNMTECDKVLFLAKGGRIAFYGPPVDALDFFGVTDIASAYVRLGDTTLPPTHWEEQYRKSDYYQQYVVLPLQGAPSHQRGDTQSVARSLGATQPRLKPMGQFHLLRRRYADTLRGDIQNMALLLAQAPIMALILLAVFPANLFDPAGYATAFRQGSNSATPASLLFCMVISALLFGVINAAREITKEGAIFRRERMVNLQPGPYLFSKVVVLSLLCTAQSLILVGILRLKIDFHIELSDYLVMTGILVAMTICSSLLGLMLSGFALATTMGNDRTAGKANDRAMSLVPLVVLPQIVFSGLINLESLGTAGKFMPSYWAYGALGNIIQLNATMASLQQPSKEQFDIAPLNAALALCLIGLAYTLAAYGFLARKK